MNDASSTAGPPIDRRTLLGGSLLLSVCVMLPGIAQAAAPTTPIMVKVTLDSDFTSTAAKAMVVGITEAITAALGATSAGAALWVQVHGPGTVGRGGTVL